MVALAERYTILLQTTGTIFHSQNQCLLLKSYLFSRTAYSE